MSQILYLCPSYYFSQKSNYFWSYFQTNGFGESGSIILFFVFGFLFYILKIMDGQDQKWYTDIIIYIIIL